MSVESDGGACCKNCTFMVQEVTTKNHQCHAHPPRVFKGVNPEDEIGITLWPQVYSDDWCGEWQEAEEATAT
jgi:hypothetical protein